MSKVLFLYFFLVVCTAQSQKDSLVESPMRWLNKKIPAYQSKTIDGKIIDSNYFKGKVTLVCFFGFNCSPCRQELSLLSELDKSLPKDKCQILLIGDAAEKDLNDLRSPRSKTSGKWKRKMGIDTLTFDLVSDCPNNPVKFVMRACRGATVDIFRVYGTPATLFVNQEGIVKKVCLGFSVPRNKQDDEYFYSAIEELQD